MQVTSSNPEAKYTQGDLGQKKSGEIEMHQSRHRYHRSRRNYHQLRHITMLNCMDEINVTIGTKTTKSRWNHLCLSFICLESSPFLEYFLSQISQTNAFSGVPPCCLEHFGTCLTKLDFCPKVALQ